METKTFLAICFSVIFSFLSIYLGFILLMASSLYLVIDKFITQKQYLILRKSERYG